MHRMIGSGALTEGALNVDWSFGSRKIVRVGYINSNEKRTLVNYSELLYFWYNEFRSVWSSFGVLVVQASS